MKKKITPKEVKLALQGADLIEDPNLRDEARARIITIYIFYLLHEELWQQFFPMPPRNFLKVNQTV